MARVPGRHIPGVYGNPSHRPRPPRTKSGVDPTGTAARGLAGPQGAEGLGADSRPRLEARWHSKRWTIGAEALTFTLSVQHSAPTSTRGAYLCVYWFSVKRKEPSPEPATAAPLPPLRKRPGNGPDGRLPTHGGLSNNAVGIPPSSSGFPDPVFRLYRFTCAPMLQSHIEGES